METGTKENLYLHQSCIDALHHTRKVMMVAQLHYFYCRIIIILYRNSQRFWKNSQATLIIKKYRSKTIHRYNNVHTKYCVILSFTELQAQLKEVKVDIANSTKEQVKTDYLSTEMNKPERKYRLSNLTLTVKTMSLRMFKYSTPRSVILNCGFYKPLILFGSFFLPETLSVSKSYTVIQ